jgi:hypothetical protein
VFRRRRFADVISRQLDLFEEQEADLIAEVDAARRAYDAADRDEAEDKYGDYLLLVEAGTEALAAIRDHFKRTLDEEDADEYEAEFNRAVTKRLRTFALDIENT